jgi:hypothetical protein
MFNWDTVLSQAATIIPNAPDLGWVEEANIVHPGTHCRRCHRSFQYPPSCVRDGDVWVAIVKCETCDYVAFAYGFGSPPHTP